MLHIKSNVTKHCKNQGYAQYPVYTLNNDPLAHVPSYKYLGVTITSNLSWTAHTQRVQAKAARSLGVIRRTLGKCDRKVKETAYKQLVRPQLEYACCAWNPYTQKDIQALEGIQRQAARFVLRDYRRESSVTEMLSTLKWDTLQHRRLSTQCEMLFKVHHHLVNINMPREIKLQKKSTRNLRSQQGHDMRYIQPQCRINAYMYSMFPRATRIWNSLPGGAVNSNTLVKFREETIRVIRTLTPPRTLQIL